MGSQIIFLKTQLQQQAPQARLISRPHREHALPHLQMFLKRLISSNVQYILALFLQPVPKVHLQPWSGSLEDLLNCAHKLWQCQNLFRKAALAGNDEAIYMLSLIYGHGSWTPPGNQTVSEWFEKVAVQGGLDTQFSLACMYEEGRAVPKNHQKPAEWFEKAALQGDSAAQFNLGLLYREGRGVDQNDKKAALQGYVSEKHELETESDLKGKHSITICNIASRSLVYDN